MTIINKITALMDSQKVSNIKILDFRNISFFVDFYIIGTIQSESHSSLIIKKIADLAKTYNLRISYSNTKNQSGWMILDFGDFLVHLFTEETREYYDIENLWSEAEIVKGIL